MAKTHDVKAKKCKVCRAKFIPRSSFQLTCSIPCAFQLVRKASEKKWKKDAKLAKERLMTKTDYLKRCQAVFNKFINLRDRGKPCIACNKPMNKAIHASHYRTTKAASQLRFNEDNCHSGCYACNVGLSGNILEYRINLIKRIGPERVEALENNNEVIRWSVDEIKGIEREYKEKIKALKRTGGDS